MTFASCVLCCRPPRGARWPAGAERRFSFAQPQTVALVTGRCTVVNPRGLSLPLGEAAAAGLPLLLLPLPPLLLRQLRLLRLLLRLLRLLLLRRCWRR